MEIRSFQAQIREIGQTQDGWEFDALAVPWDTRSEIFPGCFETIPRDALTPDPAGMKLRLEHRDTIGVIPEFRSEADGLHISARISDTALGRDARTLIKDGALSSLSIGFRETEPPNITWDDADNMHVEQRAGVIKEVSLVTFPAYQETHIESIRSYQEKDTSMPTVEQARRDTEATALSESVDRLERSFALMNERLDGLQGEPESPIAQFRSFGEYAKALAAGDELAARAYTGATTESDKTMRPAWVNRVLTKMVEKQRITNLFHHSFDLPAQGMSIEFPLFGEDTVKVDEQANQGDDLQYGAITLTTGTAKIKTYGGYSAVSKQEIDRGSEVYLTTLFERQAMHYARRIETATKTLLNETITSRLEKTTLSTSKAATALTVDDIVGLLLDAAEYYDDHSDLTLDGIGVSKDVFKYLATLDAKPKMLKFTAAAPGDNNLGTIAVTSLQADLASIPVHLIDGTGIMTTFSSEALQIQESPGAPLRLQDENIINLSKLFSVYGYAAHYVPDPAGILPVKFSAGAIA